MIKIHHGVVRSKSIPAVISVGAINQPKKCNQKFIQSYDIFVSTLGKQTTSLNIK